MLVLSRKIGEKILIGENVSITVVKIDPGRVRIGIEAPSDVPVYREEIFNLTGGPDRRPRHKYTDWSFCYRAAEPYSRLVRYCVSDLHTAFPGATITAEPSHAVGDSLEISPPDGSAADEVRAAESRAHEVLKGVFDEYLRYRGWTVRFRTGRPQSFAVRRRLDALKQCFPGADVLLEPSDEPNDHLVIAPAGPADGDAKLDAFRTANAALKKADAAPIEELKLADREQIKALFSKALSLP